jgi:hypothetical protein
MHNFSTKIFSSYYENEAKINNKIHRGFTAQITANNFSRFTHGGKWLAEGYTQLIRNQAKKKTSSELLKECCSAKRLHGARVRTRDTTI